MKMVYFRNRLENFGKKNSKHNKNMKYILLNQSDPCIKYIY